MSDERLSRAIAEFLEPQPPDCSFTVQFPRPPRSKGEMWSLMYSFESVHMVHREATPRDMVNNPAMTVMLLEKLVVLRGFVSLSAWVSSPTRVCVTGQICDGEWKSDEPSTYAAEDTLGRAVALAFARAHGLKVEE